MKRALESKGPGLCARNEEVRTDRGGRVRAQREEMRVRCSATQIDPSQQKDKLLEKSGAR